MPLPIAELIERISQAESECLAAISACRNAVELTDVDNKFLSKKGILSELLKSLRDVAAEDRPKVGARANEAKLKLEAAMTGRRESFEEAVLREKLQSERIDYSMPARK